MGGLLARLTLTLWKSLVLIGLFLNLIVNIENPQLCNLLQRWGPSQLSSIASDDHSTNLSHIAFGMMGSVETWPQRRGYLEAWWRANKTRGYVFLDEAPPPELLPWPSTAPPYRVADDLSGLFGAMKPQLARVRRMVHGILEVVREEGEGVRWVVMGDDDTVVFLDNMVDVLAELDHNKYYYLGWHSENMLSNLWISFDQAFGGGGIVMSYSLARAVAADMDGCLVRYNVEGYSSDLITMSCIADVGVNLTPHKGLHQVDLFGDFSGYLSAHPKVHLMTLHHFDAMDPIFPSMDRIQSTRHLFKAGDVDQSRLLQQTICYHKKTNWSVSISWGYSAQIYERIYPRSFLQIPIETFKPRAKGCKPPFYMFNTRPRSQNPCENPHFFFLQSVSNASPHILTTYTRATPRGLPPCNLSVSVSADSITTIQVTSPPIKRIQIDRCECCDIVRMDGVKVEVGLRECKIDEIIA